MRTNFETPSHDTLLAEQAVVQAEKFQGRLLAEYDSYLFADYRGDEAHGNAVIDFAKPFIGDNEQVTLEGLIQGLSNSKLGSPVSWVDMGGGRALPMRQLARMPNVQIKPLMTNVDLFNFGLDGVTPEELEYLETLVPRMTEPEAEPTLIIDNVETVKLPAPADIITSVEAMQYLNDPLGALVNWYNQLADEGMMIVATQHDWASWIRYQREPSSSERDETPTQHLLEELSRNAINCAVTYENDWGRGRRPRIDPGNFRIMAIQKKPSTSLRVNKPVTEVWVNPYDFKAVNYEAPSGEASSIVEVVQCSSHAALGGLTLRNRG